MANYIAAYTAFTAAPPLAALFRKSLDLSPQLGTTKVAALIKNVLGPTYKEDLLARVRGRPYSLIIDESTDVSVHKALGIIIRYPDLENGRVIDTFYRLVCVSRGDAESINAAVRDALKEDNLDLRWLVGLGVDGASSMVGRHHSVSTLMKETIPHLTVIHCVSHSLAKVHYRYAKVTYTYFVN